MSKAAGASDYAPLLVPESDDERTDHLRVATPPPRRVLVTACYCMLMVVNGGMCGAFGPSLEYFERRTGLSQGVLGGAVMQNRLAKLGGTILWGWYATRLQQQRSNVESLLPPHHLMAAVLLVSACCSAVLGFTRSGAMLQFTMIMSGFMYGVSDSAANLLIMWVWDFDSRKQRINVRAPPAATRPACARCVCARVPTHLVGANCSLSTLLLRHAGVCFDVERADRPVRQVAVLNAMFTIGAFVTPMLIAASIHFLRGHVWPAYYVLSAISIVEALALPLLPSPPPPRGSTAATAAAGSEVDVELEAVPLAAHAGSDGKARNSDDHRVADEAAVAAEVGTDEHKSPKMAPATTSKAKRASDDSRFVYLGDPGSDGLPRHVVVMVRRA